MIFLTFSRQEWDAARGHQSEGGDAMQVNIDECRAITSADPEMSHRLALPPSAAESEPCQTYLLSETETLSA